MRMLRSEPPPGMYVDMSEKVGASWLGICSVR
ncbi:Uncharacterised protein [Mycobacteroides abscessus]|nr:Uncharacterised protein [Mycobacteroides abscessus]